MELPIPHYVAKQHTRINIEGLGQLNDDRQRGHVVAALHKAEVACVHGCALGELFLSPATLLTKSPNGRAEDHGLWLTLFSSRHPCILPIDNPYCRLSMGKISRIDERRDLSERRTITLDLPEFLLRAFEQRVAEANEDAAEAERITIQHAVEIQLAEGLSLADVAFLERELPGISVAVTRWLEEIG